MLKQRVITGSILAAVVTSVVFFASPTVFSWFIVFILVLGAWEWANLSGLKTTALRIAYVVSVLIVLGLSYAVTQQVGAKALRGLLVLACAWWALCLLWVQSYPASSVLWQPTTVRMLMGWLVMVPVWHALVYLRSLEHGYWLVLTLIALVAAADTGAYFTGKAFGKHKLAPHVSPGKTWEGVAGGAVFASVFLAVIMFFTVSQPIYWALVLALPTALVSVLGDLFESMLKRHSGIKDSSNLLPGHGGVLDRVDGLIAAAPVFALAILSIGWSA